MNPNLREYGERLKRELEGAVEERRRPDLDDIDCGHLLAMLEEGNAWKDAVIDECVMCCINWDEQDPKKTLARVIDWNIQVALDPRVSADAKNLRQGGLNDAAQVIDQAARAAADNNDLRGYELLRALRDAIVDLDAPKGGEDDL